MSADEDSSLPKHDTVYIRTQVPMFSKQLAASIFKVVKYRTILKIETTKFSDTGLL
jgi:hypothetical protein